MKPKDLIRCSIRPTIINSYLIKEIEVDLKHINYGLNLEKGYGIDARSNFDMTDIARFFESLHQIEINSVPDENWEYFVVDKSFFCKKKYRMVFCIDRNEPNTSGIITFYGIKRR